MLISTENWINNFDMFSRSVNGQFSLLKSPSGGYGPDYMTAEITYNHIGTSNIIIVHQGAIRADQSVNPSDFIFEYTYNNSSNFFISFRERDFLDIFFSIKRIEIGDKEFDKRYFIKSSDKNIALEIFKDYQLKSFFMKNKSIVFNVFTKKNNTKVLLKFFENKMYKIEEMNRAKVIFEMILDKILST